MRAAPVSSTVPRSPDSRTSSGPALPTLALVAMTLLILTLVENSRIPVDDPTTHLELTMIHEVMVLDHSGPDLGIIHYAAALKLWVLGSLLVGLVVPLHGTDPLLDGAAMLFGMPLALFGPQNYGYRLGLIGAPARMAQAAAPLAFGLLIDTMGSRVLIVSSALSLSALLALSLVRKRPAAAP